MKLLLWEKWRPRTIDEVILLPRIKNQFDDGVSRNYIFYGHFGTGKTTLARILIGKYTKDTAYLEINSSLFTSVDIVRSKIDEFCKKVPMLDGNVDDVKFVFLDEFERMSPQAQDSLKAFIEHYHKNVRFILTTNHVGKISDGIKSRFTAINFDCESVDEEKFLKKEIFKRISSTIVPSEGKEITKEQLVPIINKNFPDFRSIIMEVQNFIETGSISFGTSNVSNKLKLDLYNLIFNKSLSYNEIYHFIMDNFGPEKIDVLMKLLERPFIEWYIKESKGSTEKLFKSNKIITIHFPQLESQTDPIILGMSVIGEFRDLFLNI